jgi:hypothetical protein
MSELYILDLFQKGVKHFPPTSLPDVKEKILLRIREGETFTINIQDGNYTLEEGGSEAAENIVEVPLHFLCNAIKGSLDIRTLWTAFAEPKDDSFVKKGNGASLLPLIQSMKKAYASHAEIKEKIDKMLAGLPP